MGTKTMKGCTAGLSVAEMRTEVAHERINPDAFDGLCVAMEGVELAASLGITQVLPVGGFVASAGEARLFDEGFEQDGARVREARLRQVIHGRMRKRALLTTRCKWRWRCSLLQPMASSRGLVFQALAPKPSTATISPAARTK